MMRDQLMSLVSQLVNRRVLVIGDVILDEYLSGKATRMSREAPVPVLEFEERRLIPGGAANPAANIHSLGGAPTLVGVIGADTEATALRQILQAGGIETSSLIVDSSRPTTVKTRILAQMGLRFPQQVARLDRVSREAMSTSILERLRSTIVANLTQVEAVLLSDYQTGLLSGQLIASIRKAASGILLAADAQGQFRKYMGFGMVKCNASEAEMHLRVRLQSDQDFAAAARELCSELQLTTGVVITRGVEGATIATADGKIAHIPAPSVTDVYDTVGAGDTAVAVITMALAAGESLEAATALATYASGLVVRKVGNYTPTGEELMWALKTWLV